MAEEKKGGLGLLKQTFKDFSDDECPMRAAALSYYTAFSLPALLVLVVLIAGAFLDPEQVQRALTSETGRLIPGEGKEQIKEIFANAKQPDIQRPLPFIISIGALIFGATGVFLQLQTALNRAWEVKPDPKQGGIKNFVFKRLLSIGMVLGIAFVLLVSLALTSAVSALSRSLGGAGGPVAFVLENVLSFIVVTGLFAAIFKVLPDAEIGWRDVWVGALVTAALFTIGKFALGLYLGRSDPGSAFGAAGSLALLLVWVYYAAMIVLFGAEFTQTWAERRGGGIQPEEGAVKVVEETREVRQPGAEPGTERT